MHTPNRREPRTARARSAPPPRPHRFVIGWNEVSTSKRPEQEVAFLETILADTWSSESLRRGDWIRHATTVGLGPARALALIERFLDFHRTKGTLSAWDRRHLGNEVAQQRIAHRLIEGPVPSDGYDERVSSSDLDELAARFAETLTHPIDRSIGAGVVAMTALALKAQDAGSDTAFGALDVPQLVRRFLLADAAEDEDPEPTAAFLRILAELYAWRGAEGRLDPARATELANELRATALAHGALRVGRP
jgi:hypothetical protein